MMIICVNCCISFGIVPVFQDNNPSSNLKFDCQCCNKKFNTSVMTSISFIHGYENRLKVLSGMRNRKIDSINALEN